jgi:ABC-2 type transport system permease protein
VSSGRGIARIAAKEVRDIVRERSIVVALVVQFFIAAFSTYLAVGLLALYDPESAQSDIRADVAYVGPGGFDAHLAEAPWARVVVTDLEGALAGFHARRLEAVVQEQVGDDGVHRITVLLPEGNLQATLVATQVKGVLQDYERELRDARQDRLDHELREVGLGPQAPRQELPFPFLYATLLPLLFLTPVFLAGAVAADSLAGEIQSRTLTILRSAPLRLEAVLGGKLAVHLALAPAQFLLWAGLMELAGVPVANLPLLCLASLLVTATLAGVGFALAARLRRDGPTQASYALVALAFGALALLLPRDPLNLVAHLATGRFDADAATTLAILGVTALASIALGFTDAARQLRARPD